MYISEIQIYLSNRIYFCQINNLTAMNVSTVANPPKNVESHAKAPDITPELPDSNTLVLYSTLTFYWRFCHKNCQQESDEWRRKILWHARSIKGSILKLPSLSKSEDVLNYNILERFQKYFLPQHEHFMRTLDLGRKVEPKFIFDVNPYCLEDLPESIVEVGFERWRLDEDGQPVWKLCRSALFAQDPLTFPHSQYIIVSSEHALEDQIIQ